MKVLKTKLLDSVRRARVIKEATVKDFSGGLDLSDDDLNINSQYAKVLTNMYRSRDGRLRLRYGVSKYADMPTTTTGKILNIEYFAGCAIVGTDAGEIVAFPVNGAGSITVLWPVSGSSTLKWSTTGITQINFAQSRGELIIVNGKDKPLRLKSDFSINFLGDAGNGNSNNNTPIASYVVTCNNYVVMAGQSNNPSKLYFSSKGTTGTFSGDPAPNDATSYDVGSFVAHGDNIIVGLASLNNFLFVAFETSTVVVATGSYTGTAHTPSTFDVYDTYGAISQRTMSIVDKELWYADQSGVLRITRNQLGTNFLPERTSAKIDPKLLKDLAFARQLGNIRKSFALYNRLSAQYLIFIPETSGNDKHTWVSTRYDPNSEPSWSVFEGLDYTAGMVSSIGKMYLATDRALYLYGDINNEIFSDNGTPIFFDWEMPWSVFSQYDQIKKMKAIRIYTSGTAYFSLQLFVDGIYKNAKTGDYDPAAQIDFSAADIGGFGNESGIEPYGGGRSAGDPRIWKYDGKFIQGKFRVTGTAISDLQIIGLSISYTIGGRKR